MALRIDPFILYTADRHPDVAARLRGLAADLVRIKTTLIQGDISPKNILTGPNGPVFLDAECATYGDPAFDLAFCLTHLLLKSIWVKGRWEALMQSFDNLAGAYLTGVDWEDSPALSRRAAALVGALLLARVDGKSPSGYLDAAADDLVRRRAKALLRLEGLSLADLSTHWRGPGAPA
jgi:aminoglycoside phosphotransferase (APT) family kinase protein